MCEKKFPLLCFFAWVFGCLEWFVRLFTNAIVHSIKSETLEARIEHINSYFTKSLYNAKSRSLFEKDKLVFALLLCRNILSGNKTMI